MLLAAGAIGGIAIVGGITNVGQHAPRFFVALRRHVGHVHNVKARSCGNIHLRYTLASA